MTYSACRLLTYDSRRAWHTPRIICEMLPEIHRMEKCNFLKSILNT